MSDDDVDRETFEITQIVVFSWCLKGRWGIVKCGRHPSQFIEFENMFPLLTTAIATQAQALTPTLLQMSRSP